MPRGKTRKKKDENKGVNTQENNRKDNYQGGSEEKKGFITLTVVFEAMSLNRDEGIGNIQSLHLLTRGDGNVYSYMSRQALTYAVRKFLIESGEWPETPVESSGDVCQYKPDIKKYPEVDLFGYMVTEEKTQEKEGSAQTRPAAVTFTHAISMEPYQGDMGFYANPEMARRSGGNPNPFNRQEHKSLYKYSVVIDLERIGIEEKLREIKKKEYEKTLKKEGFEKDTSQNRERWNKEDEGTIIYVEKIGEKKKNKNKEEYVVLLETTIYKDKNKRIKRITQLLDAIANLGHQIMGYREPLYPLFIVAAHIKYGSPIFHNYVELKEIEEGKAILDGELLKKGLEHADKILKKKEGRGRKEKRLYWAILENAGGLHLTIDNKNLDGKKKTPLEVIEKVKKWVEKIYQE